MMRLWWCICVCVVVTVRVEAQSNGVTTKIGLVSSDLGLPPVVGNPQGIPTRTDTIEGCVCLPVNQVCPSQPGAPPISQPVVGGGGGGGGGHSGAGIIDIRIVNLPSAGACPGQKLCCPDGSIPPRPGQIGRPRPVRPFPAQINTGACGIQNPQPLNGQGANIAEADFGEYPWMAVVLDFDDNYKGGGALISENWVLTAAHKVVNERNLKVRLGDYDVSIPQEHPSLSHVDIPVSNVIIHPQFKSDTLQNDVGLLRLRNPVNTRQYPHIGTVCLPQQDQIFDGDNQCWVTGYGKDAFDSTGQFQRILKEVDVPMVDPIVCQHRLRNTRLGQDFLLDRRSFVCAGGIAGKDACTGDGGAPLVCRPEGGGWTVVGLVAWGIGCASSEVPGVYVSVPAFANFIRQHVRA
ncbi:phenoloxidase-activating factor 2 isoform X1 [Cherax quadricarinatus]